MKRFLILTVLIVCLGALSACSSIDIVGEKSAASFGEVLKIAKVSGGDGAWTITAPDDSAAFNFSNRNMGIVFDAKPFINAGLDTSKLPTPDYLYMDDKIYIDPEMYLSSMPEQYEAQQAFEAFKEAQRSRIGYHHELDHFGASLGGGNMFEWAKDMSKNDKDIVFVLDPKAFTDAGVDATKVEGWVFAKVDTKDASGKSIQVDKLLKPFDIG